MHDLLILLNEVTLVDILPPSNISSLLFLFFFVKPSLLLFFSNTFSLFFTFFAY